MQTNASKINSTENKENRQRKQEKQIVLPCANRTNPVTTTMAIAIILALVKIICTLVAHLTLAQLMAVMVTVCVINLLRC